MRTLRIVTASTLLAGAAIVVPVVSVGATPHAVKPSLQRVPMPAAHAAASGAALSAYRGCRGGGLRRGAGHGIRERADP